MGGAHILTPLPHPYLCKQQETHANLQVIYPPSHKCIVTKIIYTTQFSDPLKIKLKLKVGKITLYVKLPVHLHTLVSQLFWLGVHSIFPFFVIQSLICAVVILYL